MTSTPPGFEHGEVATHVAFALKGYARRAAGGRVAVESGVYTGRDPDTVCGPDAAFWHSGRLQAIRSDAWRSRPMSFAASRTTLPTPFCQDFEWPGRDFFPAP